MKDQNLKEWHGESKKKVAQLFILSERGQRERNETLHFSKG